ncbi:MAG: putative baseplate assembly protein [Kofleriaceae bacterium]|nr:putative baseplate assembly protein [Myxococcales bacterium]MCB9561030.1 putative baseplate assembly protein [Kofleriaceae bacterium]MCB9574537.1 putative baseplate assembly protein [Kofleriaceae bacterium]
MIPPPKLDDRSFQDIVEEAISMIPRYAPEWTNHNPSDPGITLIELAAWMTDLLLFRLNQVPEKNYIAFLNLLGIKLRPPRAAKALLQFKVVENAGKQKVPFGTQVSTPQAGDDETVTFETARDVVVHEVALDRCFSYFDDSYSDNSRFLAGGAPEGGFEVFGGAQRVERFIYMADPRFAGVGEASVLRLYLGCPERGGRDLARLLEWEYWNGDRWAEMRLAPIEVDRGEVAFFGPLAFAPTTVHHVEGLWVRARLAEVPESSEDTEVDTLRARVEVVGEGLLPEKAYSNLDTSAYIQLDLGKNAYPFGKDPKVDCVLYLACDELLQTADAYIGIEMQLADAAAIPRPNPSDQLVLGWEYFDGKRWRHLGRTGPRGILPGAGDEFGFHDETRAFSQSGTTSFRRPKDMAEVDVNGDVKKWIRVRIEKGDFGEQGTYTLDNDKWTLKDDRPLRPPAVRAINFRYREDYRDVRHVLSFNDFTYTDITEVARTEFTIFQPFTPASDESPALYLGFADRLPNDLCGVYFQLDEELGLGSLPVDHSEVGTPELAKFEAMRKLRWESEQRVIWEYWDGKAWEPLATDDETRGFTASGFTSFVGPDDWEKSMKFTEERHWIRARLEMGGYVKQPRVRRILTNVIDAYHHETFRDETLGSSDGSPLQVVKLLRGPVLEDEVIEIRERQRPQPEDIEDLASDAVRPIDVDSATSQECWVRWRRVDSFFDSGPRSRHYAVDYVTGEIKFGDGRKGMVPPEGKNNIVARSYRIGGGAAGNVNPGTLSSLTRALSYIDSVTNPLAAAGGADRETVEEAKQRAPYTIKSRDRAVTSEDFEMLALRASTILARAKCVPDRSNRGAVTLVLVPKAETRDGDLMRRLLPSNEILRYTKRYLDERKLVGTVLNVIKPRYRDLSLRVVLIRRTVGTSDRLRRDIELKLRRFLHSLVGGRDAKGWEFGRPVLKSDLVHLVEEVPGVEGVDALEIRDEGRGVGVEHIRLDEDELPFLVHVHIAEKVRDEIM